MNNKKLLLMLLTAIFICGCHRNGYDPNVYKNEIEFNTYEELMNDIRLEDEFVIANPPKEYDDFLPRCPSFDASLPDSIKTQYFKCGIDITKTSIINQEELKKLDYDLHILRHRWIYIKNYLSDYLVFFSFYNIGFGFQDYDFPPYDPDSFKWEKVDTVNGKEHIDNYPFDLYDQVNNLVKEHTDLYGGTTSYRVVDSNNNRIIDMHILGKENTVSVFNEYNEYIMNKCLEMFL